MKKNPHNSTTSASREALGVEDATAGLDTTNRDSSRPSSKVSPMLAGVSSHTTSSSSDSDSRDSEDGGCGNCILTHLLVFPVDVRARVSYGYIYIAYMWPSMHKPTIHCKTSKSIFLHHTLTELLLITTVFFFFPYDLLFSSYTTVSVIQLKMHISRNVRFRFCIRNPFTNSTRTNCFVFNKCIQSSWTKLCQKVRSRG